MLTQIKQNIIIKNSNGNTYYFYLDNNNTVKYERFSNNQSLSDTNTLVEDKVIDFSADIDKNDRIHVLCLCSDGKLKYLLFSNEQWSNSIIANLDTKSNNYSNLSLRFNNDNLHIMYAYSNLINSSVWTIQHIMKIQNKWEKMNVISITAGKSVPYYKIDFDKFDNIHMVYKAKASGKENIYYISFNLPLKKWSKLPQQISDSKSDNISPYLFVDSKDNIHIVWCTLINHELQLTYKHLSFIGNNKFKWKSENLPVQCGNISNPIIYEDKDLIRILFNNNNVITSIYSHDSGFTWRSDSTQNAKLVDVLEIAKYSSNYQFEKNKYKVNDLYLNVECSFIQLPEKFLSKSDATLPQINNIVVDTNSIINGNPSDYQNKIIEQSHRDDTVSILENLDDFKEELVKDFITSTKTSIETMFNKEDEIIELKTKIEKIIFDNSLCLDEKIAHYNNCYEEITDRLDNLEKLLHQCKNENNTLLDLIDSVRKIIINRESTVLLIESNVNQIKETISSESNQSLLKKILSVFKKDI